MIEKFLVLSFIYFVSSQFLIQNDGPCSCDLTPNTCDQNCCCDQNCTSEIKSFTCENTYIIPSRLACFPNAVLFRNNTNFNVNITGEQYCVYDDNYTVRNFYYKPKSLDSKDVLSFDPSFDLPIFSTNISVTEFNVTKYQINSNILTYIPKTFLGFLSIGTRNSFGSCDQKSFVRYLINQNDQCTYKALSCNEMPIIRDFYPSTDLKVMRIPSALFEKYPINSSSLSNTTYLNLTCIGSCNPSLISTDAGNGCSNVVLNISYILNITGELLDSVTINIQTGTVVNKAEFVQNFNVQFNQASFSTIPVVTLSGNPGYLEDSSIRSVPIASINSGDTSSTVYNTFEALAILNTGECGSANRYNVKFLQNINMDCFINLPANKSNLTNIILEYLKPITPELLGPFGNTVQEPRNQLVPVLKRNISDINASFDSLTLTSYSLDIVYARNGTVSMPQNKIIGARITYSYENITLYSNNKLWLSNSVRFVDNSQLQYDPTSYIKHVKSHRSVREFFYLLYAENSIKSMWQASYPMILSSIMTYIVLILTHFL